ncbi:unnamed protein product [Dicrocoelium dendriticum]|nr:unnamed protein product [Dicrocoelium dendriticum]
MREGSSVAYVEVDLGNPDGYTEELVTDCICTPVNRPVLDGVSPWHHDGCSSGVNAETLLPGTHTMHAHRFLAVLQPPLVTSSGSDKKGLMESDMAKGSCRFRHKESEEKHVQDERRSSKTHIPENYRSYTGALSDFEAQQTLLSSTKDYSLPTTMCDWLPSNEGKSILADLQRYTTALVHDSSISRAASIKIVGQTTQLLDRIQAGSERFSKRHDSLLTQIEKRSQVNKRLRAKIRSLLTILQKVKLDMYETGTDQ